MGEEKCENLCYVRNVEIGYIGVVLKSRVTQNLAKNFACAMCSMIVSGLVESVEKLWFVMEWKTLMNFVT